MRALKHSGELFSHFLFFLFFFLEVCQLVAHQSCNLTHTRFMEVEANYYFNETKAIPSLGEPLPARRDLFICCFAVRERERALVCILVSVLTIIVVDR